MDSPLQRFNRAVSFAPRTEVIIDLTFISWLAVYLPFVIITAHSGWDWLVAGVNIASLTAFLVVLPIDARTYLRSRGVLLAALPIGECPRLRPTFGHFRLPDQDFSGIVLVPSHWPKDGSTEAPNAWFQDWWPGCRPTVRLGGTKPTD